METDYILNSEEIIQKVRKFVKDECEKHRLGNEIFDNHFVYVHDYALQLAKKLNADLELVRIAAWLHDIGSIVYGRKDHHLTGVQIAETKLREFNYPSDKIEIVKKCIFNHRGSIGNVCESIEEQIIVEADCLSFFDNIEGYFLWVIDNENLKEQKLIKKSVLQKAKNKWNQLHFEESRKLIKPKYDAVMLLFGEEK